MDPAEGRSRVLSSRGGGGAGGEHAHSVAQGCRVAMAAAAHGVGGLHSSPSCKLSTVSAALPLLSSPAQFGAGGAAPKLTDDTRPGFEDAPSSGEDVPGEPVLWVDRARAAEQPELRGSSPEGEALRGDPEPCGEVRATSGDGVARGSEHGGFLGDAGPRRDAGESVLSSRLAATRIGFWLHAVDLDAYRYPATAQRQDA